MLILLIGAQSCNGHQLSKIMKLSEILSIPQTLKTTSFTVTDNKLEAQVEINQLKRFDYYIFSHDHDEHFGLQSYQSHKQIEHDGMHSIKFSTYAQQMVSIGVDPLTNTTICRSLVFENSFGGFISAIKDMLGEMIFWIIVVCVVVFLLCCCTCCIAGCIIYSNKRRRRKHNAHLYLQNTSTNSYGFSVETVNIENIDSGSTIQHAEGATEIDTI